MLVAEADAVAVVKRGRGRPRSTKPVTTLPPARRRSPEALAVDVLCAVHGCSHATLAAQIDTDGPTLCHLLAGRLPHRLDLWQKVWLALLAPTSSTAERG